MHASHIIPLTCLFHSPLTPFCRHIFLRFQITSPGFMAPNKMSEIVNSRTYSSPAVADSAAIGKYDVMSDVPLADSSDANEGFIMFGTLRSSLNRKNVKNKKNSIPLLSPSCTTFVGKNSELMSSSNHPTPPPTITTRRRSRIDLGYTISSGYNCSVPSSNFENVGLPIGSNSSKKNPAYVSRAYSNYDESPKVSNFCKKKPASVNRPYNSPCNSNYNESPEGGYSWKKKPASGGHKFDASVGSPPMFKAFDICFSGRRNSGLKGTELPCENRESSTEIMEEWTEGVILRPGMVLLKNYIKHDEQVEIVKVCREIGLGPGGFYQPGYANGAKLRLKMMCLGLDWDPQTYTYGKKRVIDGSKPPIIPNQFNEVVIRAIQEAHSLIKMENRVWNVEDELPSMTPDVCIVNFYTNNGKLGLHQDRDESRESLRKGLPVVSFSIGDSAEFLYGDERDAGKAESVFLESGDVLIFGGESRHVFHGVSSVIPNSAPKKLLRDSCLCPGRLNLTFRQY